MSCLDSVTFEVEQLHENPFEMLGRIGAEKRYTEEDAEALTNGLFLWRKCTTISS